MKPDAYLPFYGNIYFAATDGMDDTSIVSYLRLLWHYWHHTHCSGLPDDDDYLRRVARCPVECWNRTRGMILNGDAFFALDDGKWHQKKAKSLYTEIKESYDRKVRGAALARGARVDVNPDTNPDVRDDHNTDTKVEHNRSIKVQSESESESESKTKEKEGFVLPDDLLSPELSDAWKRWVSYRKEKRKAITKATAERQFALFRKWGPNMSAGSIDQSILNGWTGLFEPKAAFLPTQPPTPTPIKTPHVSLLEKSMYEVDLADWERDGRRGFHYAKPDPNDRKYTG
jgi:uncharacterized protein YdaU (DUF1376 family)